MAVTYANVVFDFYRHKQNSKLNKQSKTNLSGVKTVFLKEINLFGKSPSKEFLLTHYELYKAIGDNIKLQFIRGIQSVRQYWHIYLDNKNDRLTLLTEGITRQEGTTP